MKAKPRLAGVELGGTKSIVILASGTDILEKVSFPTRRPEETLPLLRAQLLDWHENGAFDAIGIASFGPLQLSNGQQGFGTMLRTPKPFWSGAAIADEIVSPFDCPWEIDTDVNGAGLAEYLWGAGAGCESVCYITIGTGLGGGIIVNGRAVHGAMHPEIGHIRIRRAAGDAFAGVCPFHGDCAEGLVSGPALAARFGGSADLIEDGHPVWNDVADDIAELASTILLTTCPERLLLGGGVTTLRPFLLPMVRQRVVDRLGSYLPFLNTETVTDIIRAPAFGNDAGPRGTLALALAALDR